MITHCPKCDALVVQAITVTGTLMHLNPVPSNHGRWRLVGDMASFAGRGRARHTNHALTCSA